MNIPTNQNSLNITGIMGHTGISLPPVGTVGASGMSGYTGPVNWSPPECVICHTYKSTLNRIDINLKDSSGDSSHLICPDCLKKTIRGMKKMNRIPLVMLPLHINEENIFINNVVKKRLEKGF